MENKKDAVSLPYWILVIMIGIAAFKQIDFENLNFKNTGLGIIYVLTFCLLIFFIIKRKKTDQ